MGGVLRTGEWRHEKGVNYMWRGGEWASPLTVPVSHGHRLVWFVCRVLWCVQSEVVRVLLSDGRADPCAPPGPSPTVRPSNTHALAIGDKPPNVEFPLVWGRREHESTSGLTSHAWGAVLLLLLSRRRGRCRRGVVE